MNPRILPALALLVSAELFAASVPQMSFEQIVRDSPRAVVGTVLRSWSAWDESRSAIWTHYEVRVSETLRGPAAPTMTISEPGGVVDGLEMRVPGAPKLTIGEEAALFAYPTPLGYWRIRGWGQGRFPVERRQGRSVVRGGPLEGLILTGGSQARALETGAEDLAAFLGRVRAVIREEESR